MKMVQYGVTSILLLFCVTVITNAEAALQGRDLDGNTATAEAYYDTDLNISWLADTNYAQTMGYTTISNSGRMSWDDSMTWVSNLSVFGVTGWRLPNTPQLDSTCDVTDPDRGISWGYGCTDNELAHLFYNELGGSEGSSILASSDPDLSKFANLQASSSYFYWNDVEYSPDANYAWAFTFAMGSKDGKNKAGDSNQGNYAWAVHDGMIGTAIVPEPVSSTLFIVGGATLGLRRFRKQFRN
jgi:hypothetical protein